MLWRVRAVRQLYGAFPNGLPTVSYGPWSPVYTSTNPPIDAAARSAYAAARSSACLRRV